MIRKNIGLLDATVRLSNFSIISYLVDPSILKKLLPSFIRPELFTINSTDHGMISAVSFCDTDFKFGWMGPFSWFNMWQTNYRAYVIDVRDNTKCVWFFQTMLGSVTSIIPRSIWKMPWYNSKYNAKICPERWKIFGKSSKYNDIVEIDICPNDASRQLAWFASNHDVVQSICYPSRGFYLKTDGSVGSYSIWHEAIKLSGGSIMNLNFSAFSRLGLVCESNFNNPHSIICNKSIDFEIYLPPINESAQQVDAPEPASPAR
jgi:hypothetical protein